MEETPVEEEARRIRLLEQSRQNFIETRSLWEKRNIDDYPAAALMVALLNADLRVNAMLIEEAKLRLAQLSAKPE